MVRIPIVAALALLALVSQTSGEAAIGEAATSPSAARGLAFAEKRCSGCHAVTENRASPNPESPSFQDIANRPGVTAITLRQFLRDSHNYPAAMNFRIEGEEMDELADYIATLRATGYKPIM